MTETDSAGEWRLAARRDVFGRQAEAATRALLALTIDEPDRMFVESVLRDCFRWPVDPQVRQLAVTCIGHVGRIHGAVSADLFALLRELRPDAELGGRAEDAIGDIQSFVPDYRPRDPETEGSGSTPQTTSRSSAISKAPETGTIRTLRGAISTSGRPVNLEQMDATIEDGAVEDPLTFEERTDSMIYVEGIWHHEFPDEFVLMLSELDESRYETRKVEIFRDGRMLRASESHRADHLGEVAYPELDEINADPQFEVREVSADVFAAVWESAVRADAG